MKRKFTKQLLIGIITLGLFIVITGPTHHYTARASLAPMVIRYLNNRHPVCYYVTNADTMSTRKGILPRRFRHRGEAMIINSPYHILDPKTDIKKTHGNTYYLDDYDDWYHYLFINSKDFSSNYMYKDKRMLKTYRKTINHNKRIMRHHRHNKKLIHMLTKKNDKLWFERYIYKLNKESHYHE